MTNTITVFGGLVVAVIGVILWGVWRVDFVTVFKGCIGVTLVFAGLLALAIGISEMRASKEFESAVPSPGAASTSSETGTSSSSETTGSSDSPTESDQANSTES